MTVYVIRNGKLVDKAVAEPLITGCSAPAVILDTMDHTWHPATGEMIDSKSAFRRRTREAGCEEIGNERPKMRQPTQLSKQDRVQSIRRAFEELRSR